MIFNKYSKINNQTEINYLQTVLIQSNDCVMTNIINTSSHLLLKLFMKRLISFSQVIIEKSCVWYWPHFCMVGC